MINRFFLIYICISVCSCKDFNKSKDSEILWGNVAGYDKSEIDKVLNYYLEKNEQLKLSAAKFLINNLLDQFHYEGSQMLLLRSKIEQYDSLYQQGNVVLNRTWDSIQSTSMHDLDRMNEYKVFDLKNIKADVLIRHIESCFNTWAYPWAKGLSFEEFCEYILPIKYANEMPELWIQDVKDNYLYLIDTSKNYDVKQLCLIVNDKFKSDFTVNGRVCNGGSLNYSDYRKLRCGTCIQTTQVVSYIMGGLGIPVAMDYTPFWANKNAGHKWSALIYKGKALHFMGAESDPGKDKIYFTRYNWMRRKMAKVYRRTFGIQNNSFLADSSKEGIPDIFLNTHAIDVTSEYVPVSDLVVSFNSQPKNAKYSYLCVFNGNDWKPISISEISFLGKGKFHDMGRDILYLPSWFINKQVVPAANPFILSLSGEKLELKVGTDKIGKMTIKRKYPEERSNRVFKGENYELLYWDNEWVSVGTKQAPADSVIFNNVPANTIYLIKNIDKGFQERIFTYENDKQVWW